MNTKRIYTRKLAVYLRNQGFTVIKTVPDENVPNFFNWLFEDTDELHNAISEYTLTQCK